MEDSVLVGCDTTSLSKDVRRFEETHCLHLHEEEEEYEDEEVREHLKTLKCRHCAPSKIRESVNR